MLIKKVLNNNGFISTNEKGNEIIVIGKGIAFSKHAGDEVDVPDSAKIFSPESPSVGNQLESIVRDIPLEYFSISEYAVNVLRRTYNLQINDLLYVTLTEHIHGAVERYRQGIEIKHPLLSEVRRIYRDEYTAALDILRYTFDTIDILFPEDEAGYIVYHIVNAELNGTAGNVAEMTRLTQRVLNIVKYQMQVDLPEDSLFYDRFVTHLKFFAQRVLSGTTYADDDDEIYLMVKNKYKKSSLCADKICRFIENEYHYVISQEEKGYLIIHIERAMNPRQTY